MDTYFNSKVAVVTGAAGIICSEVARDLAALGCTVALVDLSLENAEKVAEDIRATGGKCKVYACNVTDKAAVDTLADLDWSKEYDLARNGDPNDTQTAL